MSIYRLSAVRAQRALRTVQRFKELITGYVRRTFRRACAVYWLSAVSDGRIRYQCRIRRIELTMGNPTIATVPTTTVHTLEQPTGYSAPASEQDANHLYSSGSSSATGKAAPFKKQRATPAAPALVATHANINLHNASQTIVSSGSEVQSVTSSTERLRRAPSNLLTSLISWTPS